MDTTAGDDEKEARDLGDKMMDFIIHVFHNFRANAKQQLRFWRQLEREEATRERVKEKHRS
jgi:hypothetical protein